MNEYEIKRERKSWRSQWQKKKRVERVSRYEICLKGTPMKKNYVYNERPKKVYAITLRCMC